MRRLDVDLTAVAERFGTPAYVYDLARVRAAHADLTAMLPAAASLYYSVKANPHPGVVGQLHRLGTKAEVSSAGEIDAALAGGVEPGDILLTAPGKSDGTLAYALSRGVRRFSVDSPVDLRRVESAARSAGADVTCLLRVNADQPVPGMGLAMTGTASQFGADASWVLRSPEEFRGRGRAEVTGLHLYMGTNLTDGEALLRQYAAAAGIAAELAPVLGGLSEVDLGGGFGCPYARDSDRTTWPGLRAGIEAVLDRCLPGWRRPGMRISFESGRYLVGDCGVLLSRVLDVKESKGQRFVVLDAGVNHLGGMAGLRRLPPLMPAIVPAGGAPEPGSSLIPTTVTGPLCTPLDTFVRATELSPMSVGQLLAVPNVGAYGLTASLVAFLGHRIPQEILCDGATVTEVSHLRISRSPAEQVTPAPVPA